MDPYVGRVRGLLKITEHHVNRDTIKKMKVKYCVQVLSTSMAIVINSLAASGKYNI